MPGHRVLLLKLLVLVALMIMRAPAPAEGMAASAALSRLASTLAAEPEALRADFAAVALSEMITAYELEFDKLSVPGQVSRAEIAKQARWGRALAQFLDELYLARDELDAGAPVELLISPPASVQLLVGERLVSVGSPRIDTPQLLEEQIVQVYCDSFGCDAALLAPSQPPPARLAKQGGWSFVAGQGSTYETTDGLGFMFSDVRERSRKEQICLQVGEELKRLAEALAGARLRGRTIDMRAVRVEASGRAVEQLLVFSAAGEFVRVHLPALVDAPALVDVARPWIAARSEGKRYRQRFPRAELLMVKLLDRP